ncbi:Gag protease polyprotein [Gossypium australe]|uniref:Gag protease polyprotein n=1 Tax=Gossypium australe TaxID=47621 RepID=A0A5B6VVZ0_9ROSI|nr:Gag protease polyprotein [Gossypium australe]
MDFVSGLHLTPTKKDLVWVIVDRLTKSTHFHPIKIDYSLQRLAKSYVTEIVRLHKIPVSIISDKDPRFTSRYTAGFQYYISFSVQGLVLEDILRSCVIDFRGNWKDHLPLAKIAISRGVSKSVTVEKGHPIRMKGQVKSKIHRTLSYFKTGGIDCLSA